MAALIYSIIILTNRGGADGAQPGFSSKSSSDLVLVPLQVRTCAAAPRRTEAFFNAQRLGQQEASRQERQHSQVRRFVGGGTPDNTCAARGALLPRRQAPGSRSQSCDHLT